MGQSRTPTNIPVEVCRSLPHYLRLKLKDEEQRCLTFAGTLFWTWGFVQRCTRVADCSWILYSWLRLLHPPQGSPSARPPSNPAGLTRRGDLSGGTAEPPPAKLSPASHFRPRRPALLDEFLSTLIWVDFLLKYWILIWQHRFFFFFKYLNVRSPGKLKPSNSWII